MCDAPWCKSKERKAFIKTVSPLDTESSHQYAAVDSFVHAFAKEFGAHGTPEYYGAGGVKFPDYLDIRCKDSEDQYYIRNAKKYAYKDKSEAR